MASSSASLQIDLWQTDQYLDQADNMPEELIDLSNIFSHVVRHTVTIGEETSIILRQVCINLLIIWAKKFNSCRSAGMFKL
jgi:hypothetical protein